METLTLLGGWGQCNLQNLIFESPGGWGGLKKVKGTLGFDLTPKIYIRNDLQYISSMYIRGIPSKKNKILQYTSEKYYDKN